MRIRQRVFCLMSLMTIAFWAAGAASVAGQGGTGKMPMPMPAPPPLRMPPPGPRLPPERRDPSPMKKSPRTDVYVVTGTASGSLSTADRLPESLGPFKRNKLETNAADANQDNRAVEVMRAEYGKDISIFLSRFSDRASANATMQAYAKKVTGSYSTVSRKQIKNRSGQTLGEFWMLKESGRGADALLLATTANYLYRIAGSSSEDVERVFKSLPLQ